MVTKYVVRPEDALEHLVFSKDDYLVCGLAVPSQPARALFCEFNNYAEAKKHYYKLISSEKWGSICLLHPELIAPLLSAYENQEGAKDIFSNLETIALAQEPLLREKLVIGNRRQIAALNALEGCITTMPEEEPQRYLFNFDSIAQIRLFQEEKAFAQQQA